MSANFIEFGIILNLKDGIASVLGLSNVISGELLIDDKGGEGFILNLNISFVLMRFFHIIGCYRVCTLIGIYILKIYIII